MIARNLLDEAGEHFLYEGLRRCWHPVMFADELADRPHAVTLLDERVVVVRLGGDVSAFRDLCVHRGSALSVGKVVDNEQLVCLYHGWSYNKDGACVKIPARPDAPIPSRARLWRYDAIEHAGLIWVCLEGPAELPLPEFPEYADSAYHTIKIPTYDWQCSAARRVENFVDVAHLPFVHEGILGDPEKPKVPNYRVIKSDGALSFAAGLEQQPGNPFKLDQGDSSMLMPRDPIEYTIYMPFTSHLSQPLPNGKRYVLFMSSCPVSHRMTRSFSFSSRNYDLDQRSDDDQVEYQKVILEQDRVVVETQRPEELPLDLAAEMHVGAVDRASIEYRRWLAEIAEQQRINTSVAD